MTNLFEIERRIEVVDIGANPIDPDQPYKPLLDQGLCRVTGFEPQPDALAKLQAVAGEHERYLGDVVGDGERHTLNVCKHSGLTSLFEPNREVMRRFFGLSVNSEVIERIEVDTRRLDDMDEIEHLDFLKIDIQGGELAVFRNGQKKLARALVVQTEVAFSELYEGAPTFADIDQELRGQGFRLYSIPALKRFQSQFFQSNAGNRIFSHQAIDGDFVYIREPATLAPDQLRMLALIANHALQAPDLALLCLEALGDETGMRAYVERINALIK